MQELLPKNNTNDTDHSVIQTMAPQTTAVTGEHCRSVLGNDHSWSRSIMGATGQQKQERYEDAECQMAQGDDTCKKCCSRIRDVVGSTVSLL